MGEYVCFYFLVIPQKVNINLPAIRRMDNVPSDAVLQKYTSHCSVVRL